MWIKVAGQLSDNVYQIVTPMSSHFLVSEESAVLIDSGPSAVQSHLVSELDRYLPGGEGFSHVLLTHAHFDHIGGIPFIKKWAPEAKVIAGPATAELLAQRTVLEEAYHRNREVAEATGLDMGISIDDWCNTLHVDQILGDGDVLMLGEEVEIKLVACPGHTADCVGYYIRPDAALVAAEAIGWYGGRDRYAAAFGSGHTEYLESLDRLSRLEVKALGLPHAGVLTGELVTRFFADARREAERFAQTVRERLDQGELVDEIHLSILPEWASQNICPEGPFIDEQSSLLRSMIRVLAEEK